MVYRAGFIRFSFFILFFAAANIVWAEGSEVQITTSSKEALSFFKEGRNFLENINNIKAAGLFDKAIEKDPDFALAHLYRFISYIGGNKIATEHLNKAVALAGKVTDGENDIIMYWKAANEGNELKQKVFVDKLLTSFPGDKRVQTLAGQFFYGQSNFKSALNHLQKATEIDGNYAPAYNMIGYSQINLKNNALAEKAFQKYISLLPDNPNPYDSYAELLMKEGKYDESIKQYKMAYSKDNTFFNALFGEGNNYALKGDFTMAREIYQQAFDKATNINTKLTALYWRSTSFVHEGKIDKAIETLEEQRKLAQSNDLATSEINNLNLQGFILTEAGMAEKGMTKFKEASNRVSTSMLSDEVKKNLSIQTDLNMCYSLAENNKLMEADNSLEKCRKEVMQRGNPTEIQLLHQTTGLIDMKKGNFKEAVANLEKSNLVDAPYTWYNLGVAYEMTGNKTEAAKFKNMAEKANVNGVGLAIVREKSKE